ncbi:unnamed protein product [Allacma fusca]|uniref:Uncharacterized protein n=1 Tax=Allacma fusca TaxID=39272 RepID=A0A8J2Q6K7_9HEXA|nr:unnamed protein product [Allacma fusca]
MFERATCTNLKKLAFGDVLIDEFRKKNASAKPETLIEHANITHVIIKSSTTISKKERWLIDFLHRTVFFKRLKSFRIQKVFTDEYSPEITFDFIEKYGQDIDEDVVTKFILRHRSTLKELEIGGSGLKINQSLPPKEAEKFKTVQLESFIFSLDGSGLPAFLKSQNKLQTLNCSHIFKLHPRFDFWALTSNIFDCIIKNAPTLSEVKIYPIFISDSPRQKLLQDNVLSMFAVNCKIFSDCLALRKLILGLHAYRQEEDLANPKLATLMGNRLTNIQFIPNHILELCLPVEEYSRDELELFANSFPKFLKLKSFYFGTSQLNPLNAYLIKSLWIRSLLSLPEIERIEFHNGRLEDEEKVKEFITDICNANFGTDINMTHVYPRYTFVISRLSQHS